MNAKEKKQITLLAADALDIALCEAYGVITDTSYNILTGSYATYYELDDPLLKAQVEAFCKGWTAGVVELRERLTDPTKYL